MTRCDSQALSSLLPIIGPCISASNSVYATIAIVEKIQQIDPTGLLMKTTPLTNQELDQFEAIEQKFRTECSPLIRKNRLYAICGIAGSAMTIPVTAVVNPIFGTTICFFCAGLAIAHGVNFYLNTMAWRALNSGPHN